MGIGERARETSEKRERGVMGTSVERERGVIRELKIETFSGRRRPDWQSKPGTEVAVASLHNSNVKIAFGALEDYRRGKYGYA